MAEDKNLQEEDPELRLIPDNFMNEGKMFNGMVSTRNFFEAIIIGGIIGLFEFSFIAALGWNTTKIVLFMIFTIGPVAIVSLVGVNGDSLTQFIVLFFTFMKNKRKLRYRRIVKNAKTSGSRAKSRPTNNKKKAPRTSGKK